MSTADDIKKLVKNQVALDKSFRNLDKRMKTLETQVTDLGGTPIAAPVEEEAVLPVERKSAKETSKPIENLGFKIFGGVGFLLILLGLYFLYSYAVDNGWIGIGTRVALGVIFSILIIGAAELFKKQDYQRFSHLLTGGGLALLYFTFFSTYYFQQYREALGMTLLMNTILLTVVVIVAVLLALRHDSMLMAGYAFLLGYLSAFLLGLDDGVPLAMLLYALLLSIGMGVVLWQKNWPMGGYPVIASYLLYAFHFFSANILWTRDGNMHPLVIPSIAYLCAFFLVFNAIALLLKDDEQHVQNIIISIINAFAFFGFGLALVWEYWSSWRGLFVIAIAVFYLLMAFIAKRRELKNLFEALFVLAVVFLTITIPVQLSGAWISMAWTVEGLLLLRAGLHTKHGGLRILGYILFALSAARVLLWDVHALDSGWRMFSFVVLILALAVGSYLSKEVDTPMPTVLGVAAAVILTVFIAVEIYDGNGLFTGVSSNARQVMVSVAWAVEAIAFLLGGFTQRSKAFRVLGLLLFGLVVAKILFIDLGALNDISRTVVTIIVGLIALVASFIYVKNKEKIKAFLEEG